MRPTARKAEAAGTGLATLAVRVRDHLAFEPAPDLAPLLELLDEYERYAVAVVLRLPLAVARALPRRVDAGVVTIAGICPPTSAL
jgi:hypothetical protein